MLVEGLGTANGGKIDGRQARLSDRHPNAVSATLFIPKGVSLDQQEGVLTPAKAREIAHGLQGLVKPQIATREQLASLQSAHPAAFYPSLHPLIAVPRPAKKAESDQSGVNQVATETTGRPSRKRRRGRAILRTLAVIAGTSTMGGVMANSGCGAGYSGDVVGITIDGQAVPDAFVGPIMKYGQMCGLTPAELGSQLKAEDNFTDTPSSAGAIGPAQVIPGYHTDVASGGDLNDPTYATHAMEIIDCQDSHQLAANGITPDETELMAAYNHGVGGVVANGGVLGNMPSETQGYVNKIINIFMPTTDIIQGNSRGGSHRHSSRRGRSSGSHSGGGSSKKNLGYRRGTETGTASWGAGEIDFGGRDPYLNNEQGGNWQTGTNPPIQVKEVGHIISFNPGKLHCVVNLVHHNPQTTDKITITCS